MWPELVVPREGLIDYRVFFPISVQSALHNIHVYTRPAGARMAFMMVIGGGGGGGGGRSANSTTDRGGAGGGGSGSIARLIIPWDLLPDTLYVSAGRGGPGRAAGVTGTNGGNSLIAAAPGDTGVSATPSISILRTQGNQSGGGGTLGGVSAGAGGAADGTPIVTEQMFSGLGVWTAVAGQAGGAGGNSAGGAGVDVTWGSSGITLSGGAGGGGVGNVDTNDYAGGSILGAGLVPTIPGGAAGSNNGASGFCDLSRMLFTGGAGGGGAENGVGGDGGHGAYGCGGGGGGGGTTGGTGGNGGDGLVIIASW